MIEENPNEWNKEDHAQSYNLVVLMNNWFEFIYTIKKDGEEHSDGIVCTYNLEDMTPDELRTEMISLCRTIAKE